MARTGTGRCSAFAVTKSERSSMASWAFVGFPSANAWSRAIYPIACRAAFSSRSVRICSISFMAAPVFIPGGR